MLENKGDGKSEMKELMRMKFGGSKSSRLGKAKAASSARVNISTFF
jgi:hypothetical protein